MLSLFESFVVNKVCVGRLVLAIELNFGRESIRSMGFALPSSCATRPFELKLRSKRSADFELVDRAGFEPATLRD